MGIYFICYNTIKEKKKWKLQILQQKVRRQVRLQ